MINADLLSEVNKSSNRDYASIALSPTHTAAADEKFHTQLLADFRCHVAIVTYPKPARNVVMQDACKMPLAQALEYVWKFR
jgi:hypothetical protein